MADEKSLFVAFRGINTALFLILAVVLKQNSSKLIFQHHLNLNIFAENIKRKAIYMQIKFVILSFAETPKLFY